MTCYSQKLVTKQWSIFTLWLKATRIRTPRGHEITLLIDPSMFNIAMCCFTRFVWSISRSRKEHFEDNFFPRINSTLVGKSWNSLYIVYVPYRCCIPNLIMSCMSPYLHMYTWIYDNELQSAHYKLLFPINYWISPKCRLLKTKKYISWTSWTFEMTETFLTLTSKTNLKKSVIFS